MTATIAPVVTDFLGEAYLRDAYQNRAVNRISPTLLNTADICPRRAQFYNDRALPRGFSEASVRGTAYHAALEYYYAVRKAYPETTAPSPSLMGVVLEAATASIDNFVKTMPEGFEWETSHAVAAQTVELMLLAYFQKGCYWPANFTVEAVEIPFYLPSRTAGWIRTGIIDLAVRDNDFGHLWLVDHKHSGKKWKKGKENPRGNNQPPMYFTCWEAGTGQRPDGFAFDVMTVNGDFERRTPTVSQDDIDLYLAKEANIVPLLNAGVTLPYNTGSFLCSEKWCDPWHLCPAGGLRANQAV